MNAIAPKKNKNSSISHSDENIDKKSLYRRLKNTFSRIEPRTMVLIISPLRGYALDDCALTVAKDIILVGVCFSENHIHEYTLDKNSQLNSSKFPLYYSAIPLFYGNTMEASLSTIIQNIHVKSCKIVYYSKEAYQYQELAETLEYKCRLEIKQTWINHATTSYFGSRWLHNIWHNLYQDYAYGIPQIIPHSNKNASFAIVVGAGPSLSLPLLEFISKNVNICTIFVADSALPTLLRYGIEPHFCVVLESQFYNMYDFIPTPPNNTIAIGDICCYPASLRKFKHTACISSQFAPISFFKKHRNNIPPLVPPLGSVGLLSLYLAIHFNPTYIFFAGLDFSYYKGLSHSKHSVSYTKWQKCHSRTMPWIDANVHFNNITLQYTPKKYSVSTDARRVEDISLQSFRKKLERTLLPLANSKNISCLDLNPQGIIENIQKISIKNAQKLLDDSTITNTIIWKKNIEITVSSARDREKICGQSYGMDSIEILKKFTDRSYETIFDFELQQAKSISARMKELSQQGILPNARDWDSGLDNYCFILSEDPYLLKNDSTIWKKNNIYTKIYLIAKKIEYDINKLYLKHKY